MTAPVSFRYHDLIMDLPPGIQDDRLFTEVLQRLQELSKV